MAEDSAATARTALQIGTSLPISAAHITRLHHRYKNVYGQPR